jgi:hypothetical protein
MMSTTKKEENKFLESAFGEILLSLFALKYDYKKDEDGNPTDEKSVQFSIKNFFVTVILLGAGFGVGFLVNHLITKKKNEATEEVEYVQ